MILLVKVIKYSGHILLEFPRVYNLLHHRWADLLSGWLFEALFFHEEHDVLPFEL